MDRIQKKSVCDGRYTICRILGSGGEGKVYLAEDTFQLCPVAIKEYPAWPGSDERIKKEALRLKALNHRGIPRFYELFRENDRDYLVMEYIEGSSLKLLLKKKGPPREKEVLRIASELCRLLEYMHSRSPAVYYPDLKPSNVLLDRSGRISLVDFGADRAHTRGYAAPEQYLSETEPDAQTDLYALGVTMHYLLTGKNPNEPPFTFQKVNKLNPKITTETTAIVEKLLQPSKENRWHSAREVEKAIRGIPLQRVRRRIVRGTIAAVGLALLGLGKVYHETLAFTGDSFTTEEYKASLESEPSFLSYRNIDSQTDFSFSLPEGSYSSYQLLTISYDPLYGKVCYTTDGSEPGRESTVYQDGIVLSEPEEVIRACQIGLDGERRDIRSVYRISVPVEEVILSPDRPLMWDLYYALGKQWTEPVYNYELARIRELPSEEIKEEDQWLLTYMPFLKE